MAKQDHDRVRPMIEDALKVYGLTAEKFETDEYGDLQAVVTGRWTVNEENEDQGLFEGDEGVLYVSVVGSEEHRNERPHYGFMAEGTDVQIECDPNALEPVD